ncbi:MAG: 1,4-alpha-glucan branching protein GlgB [Chlamydiota bacterium]
MTRRADSQEDLMPNLFTLVTGNCYDPHAILGLHSSSSGQKVIRLWRPGAESLFIKVRREDVQCRQVDPAGIFECSVADDITPDDYQVYYREGLLAFDPYSFQSSVGELDRYLFAQGVHYELYSLLGAKWTTQEGIQGVRFVVWAPAAKRVSVAGDFNHWNGLTNPMRCLGSSGLWELFVPGLAEGERYKFEIKSQDDEILLKSDPMAFASELRPNTASIISDINSYTWNDQHWMEERRQNEGKVLPTLVYEVHLGSWKKNDGEFYNYRELAHQLVDYCHELGFTHVELMPIMEHPLDESWGYQVSGFYAATSRYGTPQDFQYFVDYLHQNNLGVLLDWVPAHFPSDSFSIGRFDGTALYEHADHRQGFHPHWNTLIFNYGRHEVSNFLIANALFWLDKMHIDGLRVDAVASMLYLDYGREDGEWIPNKYGGNQNLEAIEFIKHLNSVVHSKFPGVAMIAEESTSFPGMTAPVEEGGLGFDRKWNMGWMNDTLSYFARDPFYRHYHQEDLTFSLLYAFNENFVLPLSHDEVVHGKRSLLDKMPGDVWQKFANLRLLYSYMLCQPGQNLIFMGGEFGAWLEWNCNDQLDWDLLEYPTHDGMHLMTKDLNALYCQTPELWKGDFDCKSFEWVDFEDRQNCVISYRRKHNGGEVVCIHNFTPMYFPEYTVNLEGVMVIEELFNTDNSKYGGSGKLNPNIAILEGSHGRPYGFNISLAPLATMIFKVKFQ